MNPGAKDGKPVAPTWRPHVLHLQRTQIAQNSVFTIAPRKAGRLNPLRELNSAKLKNNRKTLVIQENDTPLAVLLNYEQFLIMQNQLFSLLETIDVLANQTEVEALRAGLADFQEGRTTSIADIRAALNKKKKTTIIFA